MQILYISLNDSQFQTKEIINILDVSFSYVPFQAILDSQLQNHLSNL